MMKLLWLLFWVVVLTGVGGLGNGADPISTVVVVVMENRSFDHMLGWMKGRNPEINGVDGSEWNPVSASDPDAARVYFADGAQFVDPDPGHSFQAIREQVFGSNDTSAAPAPMNGFVQQARSMSENMTAAVMNGFRPDLLPVYAALVQEFAVFDRWFASVPSSTQPNRLFVHSATSHGATSNDASLRKLKYITKFYSYAGKFKEHASKGALPNYAVIEQHYLDSKAHPANDDHPSHDVYQGQLFIKEIYETLRASPQWNQTLLIITYDEHGGFFDHVPTPVQGVPSPDDIVGPDPFFFTFDRLGVRVPTIMVSPWIEKGTVVHGPNGVPTATSEYEHSSIPATVKNLFNLSSPYLTKRDAWAGTFEGILQTRTEPRTDCPVELPMPVKIRDGEANEEAKLSEFQQELMQLASVLNRRSPPHELARKNSEADECPRRHRLHAGRRQALLRSRSVCEAYGGRRGADREDEAVPHLSDFAFGRSCSSLTSKEFVVKDACLEIFVREIYKKQALYSLG
ncbi:Non-specific phospholipase C2 [Ananas comosus]|uniref:Non-specific phospholipase C2 n=1 Tax=Ananas comosus TaxID=4615 RepID=A0A199VYJ2_ANACO|nr:Non-specific phospholipase C2 [Ananas comosus]